MIETLEDIVEYLADQVGIYGSHIHLEIEGNVLCACRCCWTPRTTGRIRDAVEIERKLNA